ncbi:hypothetical protein BDZ97DRAFT_1851695 [Flammula alnicola]|nr:hypothetical protein BDZ97DRAFT_1851695 [Flammula alnicola]
MDQTAKVKETRPADSEIQGERQILKPRTNLHHDLLTQLLPPEISSEIFLHCIPEELVDKDLEHETSTAISAPLILSSVCQKWREIALTTPQLWTSVPLRLTPRSHRSLIQLAREWIGRSGQLPLLLNLYLDPDDYGSPIIIRRLIKLINRHSTRWAHLKYRGSSTWLSMFTGDSRGAPQLKTLKLHPYGPTYSDWFRLAGPKPTPRKIEISRLPLESVVIEWSAITDMQASNLSIDECLELLQSTPQMIHCKLFSVSAGNGDHLISENRIIHPLLQTLHLQTDRVTADHLLNKVALPSLVEFGCNYGYTPPIEGITSCITRSSCSLKTFYLSGKTIRKGDLIRLCQLMPALRSLNLRLNQIDQLEDFFQHFAKTSHMSQSDHTQNEKCFLPLLTRISFSQRVQLATFPRSLIPKLCGSMDEIQNPHRRPLSCLSLELMYDTDYGSYDYIDKDTIVQIRHFIDEGIDIKIMRTDGANLLALSEAFHFEQKS